ncbi:MAG: RNA degradosome polyphosphate kinase, partial [Rhodospirillaceae bacterium]|nr:RNA degradosome polyphosphate kinase [Rhodospirillaceae bacterium]
MDTPDLRLPEYYISRELSQLEFNLRVLHQAKDTKLPLLERLKFLCISSTNLDEFFEIRVSGLKQRVEVSSARIGPEHMAPTELLQAIPANATALVTEQYRVLTEAL